MGVQLSLTTTEESLQYISTRNLITSVGVTANAALTKTDVEHLLVYSGVLEDVSSWVLADLLVWGEEVATTRSGTHKGKEFWTERDDIWSEMLRFCKSNLSKSAAYHMSATAKAWPYARRRQTHAISFEHHRLLSGYPQEQQEHWMDICEAAEWSAAKLRQSLYSTIDPLVVTNTTDLPSLPRQWTDGRVGDLLNLYRMPEETREEVHKLIMSIVEEYEDELRKARNRFVGEVAG